MTINNMTPTSKNKQLIAHILCALVNGFLFEFQDNRTRSVEMLYCLRKTLVPFFALRSKDPTKSCFTSLPAGGESVTNNKNNTYK